MPKKRSDRFDTVEHAAEPKPGIRMGGGGNGSYAALCAIAAVAAVVGEYHSVVARTATATADALGLMDGVKNTRMADESSCALTRGKSLSAKVGFLPNCGC